MSMRRFTTVAAVTLSLDASSVTEITSGIDISAAARIDDADASRALRLDGRLLLFLARSLHTLVLYIHRHGARRGDALILYRSLNALPLRTLRRFSLRIRYAVVRVNPRLFRLRLCRASVGGRCASRAAIAVKAVVSHICSRTLSRLLFGITARFGIRLCFCGSLAESSLMKLFRKARFFLSCLGLGFCCFRLGFGFFFGLSLRSCLCRSLRAGFFLRFARGNRRVAYCRRNVSLSVQICVEVLDLMILCCAIQKEIEFIGRQHRHGCLFADARLLKDRLEFLRFDAQIL